MLRSICLVASATLVASVALESSSTAIVSEQSAQKLEDSLTRAATAVVEQAAKDVEDVEDGKPAWVNRNDADFEACDASQVQDKSGILPVSIEDDEGHFVEHPSILYRCDVGANPIYLRYEHQDGHTTFVNLQWPSTLDETYLFASKAEDKDDIGYGFRIMASSDTKKRSHFKRFYFNNLDQMNAFVGASSKLMHVETALFAKTDFFTAPRFDIAFSAPQPRNEFGDTFSEKEQMQ